MENLNMPPQERLTRKFPFRMVDFNDETKSSLLREVRMDSLIQAFKDWSQGKDISRWALEHINPVQVFPKASKNKDLDDFVDEAPAYLLLDEHIEKLTKWVNEQAILNRETLKKQKAEAYESPALSKLPTAPKQANPPTQAENAKSEDLAQTAEPFSSRFISAGKPTTLSIFAPQQENDEYGDYGG